MAEGYGNQVGHWRAKVSCWVSAQDDTTATVTVESIWCSVGWGFQVHYCDAYVSCDGQSGGTQGSFYAYSGYGQSVETVAYSQTFTVPKTSAARTVQCAASVVMPDYEPGSSYASVALEIPSLPIDAPAAPTGVSAARQSDAAWAVVWKNNDSSGAPYSSVEFQVREGGGDWGAQAGGSVSIAPPTESRVWQHGRANSSYAFRVRAVNPQGISAWAATETAYTTPASPSGLSASFVASSASVRLSWANAAPYASGFEVERSADGNSWAVTASLAASATSWTDADPPDGNAWYRVRSKTPDGLLSAWSQVGPVSTYTSADYPTVSITGPLSPVRDRPIEVSWTVGGPDPVASQSVSLIVGGLVVDLVRPSASARSVTLSASALEDGGSGTVVVSVTDTKGLSTTATLSVTGDYWPPAPPSAVFARTCGGAASLSVSEGSGADASDTTGFDVVRVMPDGSRETVASGVAAGQVLDPHPPLNVAYSYEIIALSDVGKTASASVAAYVGSRCGYVDFPDGSSFPVLLSPTHSETVERSGAAIDFAGGSPYPVWYPGPDVDASPSFGFRVLRADYDRLRGAAYSSDEVWVRDGFGHVWHGHPRWTLSTAAGGRYADVSLELTVTEVR